MDLKHFIGHVEVFAKLLVGQFPNRVQPQNGLFSHFTQSCVDYHFVFNTTGGGGGGMTCSPHQQVSISTNGSMFMRPTKAIKGPLS